MEVASRDTGHRLLWRLHLRVLPIFIFGYAFEFIDRTNISFAKLRMGGELELSGEMFGLASGMFFPTYSLLQVPLTLLVASRVGARRVLGSALIVSGIISGGTAFVTSAEALLGARAMLGVAEAAFFPGTLLYFTRFYPDEYAAQAVATFMSASWALASVIGSGTACMILEGMDSFLGLSTWR